MKILKKHGIKPLPNWCITNLEQAFYDTESKTSIGQTARLYGAIQELINDYDAFCNELYLEMDGFEKGIESNQKCFQEKIIEICNKYIKTMDMKIKCQDRKISDAIKYMKENIATSITAIIKEMKEMGELDSAILESFESIQTQVNNVQKSLNDEINKIIELQKDNTTNKTNISKLQRKMVNLYFDNVEEMKVATLEPGDVAQTLGYYEKNDGGAGLYKIREYAESDVDDEGSIQILANGLVAELIEKQVNIKQFGAYGDGQKDDSIAFQNAINYLKNKNSHEDYSNDNTLILNGGNYKITNSIQLSPFVSIKTNGYVTIESYVENELFVLSPEEEPNEMHVGLNRQNYFYKEFINGKSGLRIINKLDRGNTVAFCFGNKNINSEKFYTIARTLIKHININGFHIGFKIIPYDFYANVFDNIYMEQNDHCVVIGEEGVTGYKNSGENISFNKCIFAGSQIAFLYNTPEQAIDFNFNECSFDFNNCVFYSPNNNENTSPSRKISIDNSHIEGISYQIEDDTIPHGILFGTFRGYLVTISNSRILQTNNMNLFHSKEKTSYTLNLLSTMIYAYSNTVDFKEPKYPFMANDNVGNINVMGNYTSVETGMLNKISSYNNCIVRPDFRNAETGTEFAMATPGNPTKLMDFNMEYNNRIGNCIVSEDSSFEGGKSLELTVDTTKAWEPSTANGSCAVSFITDLINGQCGDIIGVSAIYKNLDNSSATIRITCYDSNEKSIGVLELGTPLIKSNEWKVSYIPRFARLIPGTTKFKVAFTFLHRTNENLVDGEKFNIGALIVEKI